MKRWSKIPFGLWALLLALIPWWAAPRGYLGIENDDALYVLAARALAEGHYRMWFLPGTPPFTDTTPGFPAFLLPAAALAPDSFLAHQLLAALYLALAAGAVALWFRRRYSTRAALTLGAAFALNPLVLSRAGVVMPEPVFLLAALGVFALLPGPGWKTGLALLGAYLIRPAALPLWGAVGLSLALQKRRRDLIAAVSIPAAGFTLWSLWARAGGGVQEAKELPLLGSALGAGRGGDLVVGNLRQILETWGRTLLPLPWALSARAALLAGAVPFACVIAGLHRRLRANRADAVAWFVVGSLAMHALWPWWYERYLVALLPFLLLMAAEGLPAALKARPRATVVGAAAVIAVAFFSQNIPLLRGGEAGRPPALKNTYAWIQDNTTPGDGFASALYARDLIWTGRVFQPVGTAESSEGLAASLKQRRARYVLWEDSVDFGLTRTDNALGRGLAGVGAALKDAGRFRPAHTDPAERTTIYEVR
jgi:hypothetical protein